MKLMKRNLSIPAVAALLLTVTTLPSIAATGSDPLGILAPPTIPAPTTTVLPNSPSPPSPLSPPSPSLQPVPTTQAPAVVTTCNAGGCLDASGNQYVGGAMGNVYMSSGGKMCGRTGVWMQCN
jgi:hypothetical protein